MCDIGFPQHIKGLTHYRRALSQLESQAAPVIHPVGRMNLLLQVIILAGSPLLTTESVKTSARAEEQLDVQSPRFTVPSALIISSGSFSLKWTPPDRPVSHQFELQQDTRRNFSEAQTIYSGPDRGTYISGLPNGEFFYRIRSIDAEKITRGPWSSTIHRTVKHPSLTFAVSLMSVGATVFFATIGMIVLGIQKEKTS